MSGDRVDEIQAEWRRERPDLDVSPQGVLGRLHRLAARLTVELEVVYARFGLAEGEFDLLASLRRAGPPYARRAGELSAHTMVTTGATSKRIDRLEAAGLVVRDRDPADGRSRVVRLTPAGVTRIDAAFTAHMANEARLLAALPPGHAPQLEALLRDWLGRVDPPLDGAVGTAGPIRPAGSAGSATSVPS